MMSSVERWLQTILCSQYAHIFEAYGYRSLHSVCFLQLPHLLAMGVPRNHCEKILENLHNLRQTMFGHVPKPHDREFHYYNKYNPSVNPAVCALKTVAMNANYRGMNQYPEEYSGYGQPGNSMQAMGFHQGGYENSNMGMMNPMSGGGTGGYSLPGYDAGQSHMMMAGQGQMPGHPAMYQQHSQQAFMAQQQQQHQQYYANNSSNNSGGGGGNTGAQYSGQPYPVQGSSGMAAIGGNSPYYNTGSSQGQGTGGPKMVPPPHHHLRNTSGQQNPQQVADNILQMASSFPSHHTVQVPLKNRHAPYQIPRSPQNYYQEKGSGQQQGMGGQGPQQAMLNPQGMVGPQALGCSQMQAKTSQPQGQMGQASGLNHSPVTMYAGSSPHSQMQQNSSPTSPLMMPSPAAAHQAQGLSSPGALHSPSSTAVCSPVPSSPGMGNMRSPSSMPMRSPAHMPSGYSCQPMSSPPQRSFGAAESSAGTQHCSPTSMHSPASHSSSPYAPAGMSHHVSSPPGSQGYSAPAGSPYKMNMLMDSGQGPGAPRTQGVHGQASDPLQSLQKLVMLPETQVVDPKSVVSDGCLQNSDDGSKNCEGPAEQSREAVDCSAGVSVVSSSPPTTADAPSTADSPTVEKSAERVSPVHTADNHSDHGDTSSCKADESKILSESMASASVSENSCTASLPEVQPEIFPSNHNATDQKTMRSTSSKDCSYKEDASGCSADFRADAQSVTAAEVSHNEISKTERNDMSESPGECKSQEEKSSSSINETIDTPSSVLCNGPVSQPKTEGTDPTVTTSFSSSSVPVGCDDHKDVTTVKSDAIVNSQGSDSRCESATSKERTAAKPSPPKKRHSQRPTASNVRSDSVVSSLTDKGCSAMEDSGKKPSNDKTEEQPTNITKPAPPKKRHSQRLLKASNPKSAVMSSTEEITADNECCNNTDNASVGAMGKEKLVNGFDDKHVDSLESDSGVTFKEKVGHKNHVKPGKKQSKSKISEVPEETCEATLVAKSKHRELIPTRVACMVSTVSEAASGGLITSSDVIDLGESDSEEVEQNSVPLQSSSSKTVNSAVHSQAANYINGHPMSDDDDSYSNELDFGYDSPPCEMQGSDDSWKPDLGKQRGTNGVDEADGNLDGAEKDSDNKGSNHNSKSPANSTSEKATASVRTRSVTRSVTGQALKRKQADSDSSTNSKRTRRSSGATDQQDAISLSMECDEIDTKDDFSDVEVISSGDDSIKNKSTETNKTENKSKVSSSASQTTDETNHKKSPIVVLSKSSTKTKKAKRTPPASSQKPKTPFRNFYSVRGVGGRFISRQQASLSSSASKVATASVTLNSSSKPVSAAQQQTRKKIGSSESVARVETTKDVRKPPESCSGGLSPGKNGETVIAKHSTKPSSSPVPARPNFTTHQSPDALNKHRHTSNMPSKIDDPKKTEARPIVNSKSKKTAKKKKTKNKTFERMDSVDDSFKSMKFSRTLNHLQRSKKGDKSNSGMFSPFIRVQGKQSTPSSVSVFNLPPADTKESKSSSKTKHAANISAPTTIQITNFSSDKSVMLPSTKTTDSSWVCALCGKRSSYRFLGDLFGPYYLESHLPSLTKYPGEGGKKDSKQATTSPPDVQNPHNTRRKSLALHHSSSVEETVTIPREVWVHEDCVMWSSGVYMVGSRMYGLEEALKATTATMCACCQEKGALIGCLHKGCNQNFHYICAVDKMCFLDVENFSMLCPKHKDKRMKSVSASTSIS